MIKDTLKMVAVSGVVSLAVSLGVLHSSPATQAAQAQASAAAPVIERPRAPVIKQVRAPAAEESGESTSIREVYSDGGYTDWAERGDR